MNNVFAPKTLNALDRLDINAAKFSEAMLIIRLRIVEAIHIHAHIAMPLVYPANMRAIWPDIAKNNSDIIKINGKKTMSFQPNSKAISRAEEVLTEFLPKVKDDTSRKLLSDWAFCIAMPQRAGSFSQYCKKHHLIKRTAERNLQAILIHLTSNILQNTNNLMCPDWNNLPQKLQKLYSPANHLYHKNYWRSEDARPKIF